MKSAVSRVILPQRNAQGQACLKAVLSDGTPRRVRLGNMTKPESGLRDEGTTPELLEEKNVAEDLLRAEAKTDQKNVNDQPGFDDGRLGGYDGEDRQGQPNADLSGSDLQGEKRGGAGVQRSGGVDGGPQRTAPLPGQDPKNQRA